MQKISGNIKSIHIRRCYTNSDMILKRYYAICVRVPTGYPDVCLIMAEDEKAVVETPLWKVGLVLIGVVEAKGSSQ